LLTKARDVIGRAKAIESQAEEVVREQLVRAWGFRAAA
jgi:hypothetical protein